MKPRTISLYTCQHRTVAIFKIDYDHATITRIYPNVSRTNARRLSLIVSALQRTGHYSVTPFIPVARTDVGWIAYPSDKNNNDDQEQTR